MVTLIRIGKIRKIGKLAFAIGFGVAIYGTPTGPAFAGGHGEERHHEEHHRDHDRHVDHDRRVYVEPAPGYYYSPPPSYYYSPPPSYYYAPPPDYYSAPEPDYYPPAYSAPPPPPSEGINLFFGHL